MPRSPASTGASRSTPGPPESSNVAEVWFVEAGGVESNTTEGAAAATSGQHATTAKVSIASLAAPIVPALKPT